MEADGSAGALMAAAYLLAPDLAVYQQCRKVPFTSRREGMRRLNAHGKSFRDRAGLIEAGVGLENFYRCGVCGSYHFGHVGN